MLIYNELDALTQCEALKRFLIQNKDKPVAKREVSQGIIEDHVVQVVCGDENGVSRSTGFLVTEGGFLVTAYHVIRRYEDAWRKVCRKAPPPTSGEWEFWLQKYGRWNFIRYQGQEFPLDITVWNDDVSHDGVVLKAIMFSAPAEQKDIRDHSFWSHRNRAVPFLHRGHLEGDLLPEHEEIEIYGLRTGVVSPQFGRITYTGRIANLQGGKQPIRDMFLTDAYIQPGYSGAPVLDSRGYCIGMASYWIPPGGQHPRKEEYRRGYAGCAPFSTVWAVLNSVADDLQEQTRTIRHR